MWDHSWDDDDFLIRHVVVARAEITSEMITPASTSVSIALPDAVADWSSAGDGILAEPQAAGGKPTRTQKPAKDKRPKDQRAAQYPPPPTANLLRSLLDDCDDPSDCIFFADSWNVADEKSRRSPPDVTITAPGYRPTDARLRFTEPFTGRDVAAAQVRLYPDSGAPHTRFRFIGGSGKALPTVWVDAPVAPTGTSPSDAAPVFAIRGFTDGKGELVRAVPLGAWTAWRGVSVLPTWDISDFSVRLGQPESVRCTLAESSVSVIIVDPDGTRVRYVSPLMIAHAPTDTPSRGEVLDGRVDGRNEVFIARPGSVGEFVPQRAFHYGKRRFTWSATEASVTVDCPHQGSAVVTFTTLE